MAYIRHMTQPARLRSPVQRFYHKRRKKSFIHRTYAVALFGIRTLCFSPALRQAQEVRQQGKTIIFVCGFPRVAWKTAHKEKIEYRSAACGERVEPKAQQANCVSPNKNEILAANDQIAGGTLVIRLSSQGVGAKLAISVLHSPSPIPSSPSLR